MTYGYFRRCVPKNSYLNHNKCYCFARITGWKKQSNKYKNDVVLLSCAEQVVTNDSGLMHVAAAVGTKLNVIYGSSIPDYTLPLTDKAVVNYRSLNCVPCFKSICPFRAYELPAWNNCRRCLFENYLLISHFDRTSIISFLGKK